MVENGAGIRLLRHLGIALIFAPEPFTTPFGVALILVARHLSKKVETNRNNQIREMVQYYLARANHLGDYAYGESAAASPAKRHGLSEAPAILGQITGSRSFEAKPSVQHDRRDTQNGMPTHAADMQSLSRRYKGVISRSDAPSRTEKVIHHTMDMEWLSHRFDSANSAVAHSSWATTSVTLGGTTHHSVNMNLLFQHNKTDGLGHADPKDHTIDTAQLRRRYGSLADGITALNALQSNNYYYDMLSRRNVIGGY